MSLEDMLLRGEVERLESSDDEMRNLISMAERRMSDAKVRAVSSQTRFEQAYQVILTCATVAIRKQGYRVVNGLYKHVRTIESLKFTLGKSVKEVRVFQKYRAKRNDDMYEGFSEITNVELAECIRNAETLLEETKAFVGKTL